MIKIPYGESNFQGLIEEGYFYQDRTLYIRKLEESTSRFLFYLRPRRFGKSLFISTLYHYYALEHKDKFDQLFGKLAIGNNPTAHANSYLILYFEFSRISTDTEKHTYEGFLSNVRSGVKSFLIEYKSYFKSGEIEQILNQNQPNELLKLLFDTHKNNKIPFPIYILIDEYDHFANELISFNFNYFKTAVSQNGFVRKFYETIKTATGAGVVHRLFVTGVSPITLDSLTSGFNISTNISLHPLFHEMMGFEEAEVVGILEKIDVETTVLPTVLNDLRNWYDGYLFDEDSEKHVYNPDMVLYFAQYYQEYKKYPKSLLDPNIASDYGKIRNVFKIQGREQEHIEVLKTLTETGRISAELTIQFSFEKTFGRNDLVSLLFYMGYLTIEKKILSNLSFRFPNYVIEDLYADYFVSILQHHAGLPIDNTLLNSSVIDMALSGSPKLFFEQVENILKNLSPRDAISFNEMTLKAIIISCLHQQQFYYVHSEYQSEKGYADIFLETIHGYEPNYQIALELKYIKKGEKGVDKKVIGAKRIQTILDDAESQLTDYLVSKNFINRKGLKGFVVVCHGDKLIWQAHKDF